TATIAADGGERIPYSSKNSALTPADIGKRVPMTNNRVRAGRSSQASAEWALAERRDPSKVAYMLCLMGIPVVALVITFRMFRDKKPAS
ncbi:MAG: hypothetical protein QOF58_5820, partial [Pseudonocardiales bacterium]|nr:hypothetical protein [Pseudonocardiales bacterium]